MRKKAIETMRTTRFSLASAMEEYLRSGTQPMVQTGRVSCGADIFESW